MLDKLYNKKTKRAFSVALLALSLSAVSCREDIVELTPYDSVGESEAYTSPSLVQLAVNGVYNAAQIGYFNGAGARGYVFGAAYFQQNEARGEDMVNTQAFYQITYESTYDPTTANNVYYWSDAYRLVNRANLVKDGVADALKKGVISQADANIYTAEVVFFRALTHLELLKHFSLPYHVNKAAMGVPYRDTGIYTKDGIETATAVGRGTVEEGYKKALADLDYAEANLPTKAERVGIDKISKLTKGAAIAIKLRAYMNMRDWAKVIEQYNKLKSTYALESDFSKVFTSNLNNTESIFSLNNTATNNPGVNGALASQFNGRSLLAISPILWRNPAWLADDKRRTDGLMTATVSGAKYTRKYKDVTNFSDASPIVRYAEMVLSAAEAYARTGDLVNGTALLNSVRNRALADPATQGYAVFTSAADLVKAIINERRIELSAEGVRWGDIHRLINDDLVPTSGIPGKVPNGAPTAAAYTLGTPYSGALTPAIPYTDKRFLWPIPLQEINNNPTLATQQNPGY